MLFLHIDIDNFYPSAHAAFEPSIRGKPIVVLSSLDSNIVALSKEAKQLGLSRIDPFFKIEPLINLHDIKVYSSNFPLYADISNRVNKILTEYSPTIEIYSIDESFLSLEGIPGNPKEYARKIKDRIWNEVRVSVSIGVGPTKTLSKLATHAGKKIPQCNGVCVLDEPEKWQWMLKRVRTNDIWGIGGQFAKRLSYIGIENAYDFATADTKLIRKNFNLTLLKTQDELNGLSCISLEEVTAPRQQIYSTKAFGTKLRSLQPIIEAISSYSAAATIKLRKQNYLASTLQVFLQTSPYLPNYINSSLIVHLPYPTNDSRLISYFARQGIKKIFKHGNYYHKAGIGLIDLTPTNPLQLDLLSKGQTVRDEKLMKVIDAVNSQYGHKTLFLGAEGVEKKWSQRSRFASPAYTTRWSDIPRVIT